MHKSAVGHDRSTIVRQVRWRVPSVRKYAEYVPVGNAVEKTRKWAKQGWEIVYLTSRRNDDVSSIQSVLRHYDFPVGVLEYRKEGEEYTDVAERVMPDILVEDDCESIGGAKQMTYPHIRQELQQRIKSIVVKEFGGIDHLPDEINSYV